MSWHCTECNSKKVETQEWVNPNTGQQLQTML